MLEPTVRNLYRLMSVQAELHDPISAYYYSNNYNSRFLLVKTHGNVFEVNQRDTTYYMKIVKDGYIQVFTSIPRFGETQIYRRGIQVTN